MTAADTHSPGGPEDAACAGLAAGARADASSAPTLASVLLPMLLHSVNNTTQLLIAVGGVPGVLEMNLDECSDDLARAAQATQDHGWVLGVLGCELGADLLLARREERGLEPLVDLLRLALRRRGGDLDGPAELPRLAPDVGAGWELPWALAWLLCCAAEDSDALRVRFGVQPPCGGGGWTLRVDGPAGARVLAAGAAILERLPESRLELGPQACEWVLPAAWLRT